MCGEPATTTQLTLYINHTRKQQQKSSIHIVHFHSMESPLTTLLCSPGGAGHLSGSHFTRYHQPTTDRLKVLQGETGERESAVCGVECTRHNSATGNAKYTELPAVNVN